MVNLTVSISEHTRDAAKREAAARGVSLNLFVRSLLERELGQNEQQDAVAQMIEIVRKSGRRLEGRPLSREEIYDR